MWCGTELCEERDSTGTNVTKRFFGQGEQISGANYYFTRDHLGSVQDMTDSSGTVHAAYDYDPYGRMVKLSGDKDADFAYTGDYYHNNSSLSLTLYRAYDSSAGRWDSRDPSAEAEGLNLYSYIHNDPVNRTDIYGLGDDAAKSPKQLYDEYKPVYDQGKDALDKAVDTYTAATTFNNDYNGAVNRMAQTGADPGDYDWEARATSIGTVLDAAGDAVKAGAQLGRLIVDQTPAGKEAETIVGAGQKAIDVADKTQTIIGGAKQICSTLRSDQTVGNYVGPNGEGYIGRNPPPGYVPRYSGK